MMSALKQLWVTIPYSGSPSLVQRAVTIKVYKVQNFIKLRHSIHNKYNTGTIATEKLRTWQFPTTFFTSPDDG
jgi:hypothetical protein